MLCSILLQIYKNFGLLYVFDFVVNEKKRVLHLVFPGVGCCAY